MPHDVYEPLTPAPAEPEHASPEAVGKAARSAILDALDLLDVQGMPLAGLLARQAMTRPDLLLSACAKFAPKQAKHDLLPTIQALHLQALRALSRTPVVIDQKPDDDWLA